MQHIFVSMADVKIDEAHERGAYTDLLLGLLKKCVQPISLLSAGSKLIIQDTEEASRAESHHILSHHRCVGVRRLILLHQAKHIERIF